MKIAIGQMNIVAGQMEANFNKLKSMVLDAKKEQVDLIVFSEMCISGYFLQDKILDHYFCQTVASYNERIKEISDGIAIVYGNLDYSEDYGLELGRDGRKARFNTVFCVQNQELISKHVKHLNPDYRVFDDSRYYLSAIEINNKLKRDLDSMINVAIIEVSNEKVRIGLEVCEDMWSNDYSVDVTKKYIDLGVDLICNVSCSPWTLNKEKSRHKRIKYHANNSSQFVPFIYCNNVGMQNSGKTIVTFDGGSTLYDSNGEIKLQLNDQFKEELNIFNLDTIKKTKANETNNDNKLLNALECAIVEFDKQIFNSKVKYVIGLSGGLDSSVNAVLFAKALGSDRIVAYNMASRYNSLTTKNNAINLANSLNIEIRNGSIEEINNATIKVLSEYGYNNISALAQENIQSRIRGHLLASFAAVENGVIINNGNKVELALGYLTLYGDSVGAFCPIADLTKVELFELSHAINNYYNKEVIPNNLLPQIEGDNINWEMPPSAELKDNQLDPMKWFYHDFLVKKLTEYPTYRIEDLLESYLDGSIYNTELGKWINYYGLNESHAFIDDLEWFLRTFSKNVFKRYQVPPVVMVSRGAFGNDFRESQLNCQRSNRYQELRKEILNKKTSSC